VNSLRSEVIDAGEIWFPRIADGREIWMLLRQFGGSGCLDEGLKGKTDKPIGTVRFQCQQVGPGKPVGASTAERIAWGFEFGYLA